MKAQASNRPIHAVAASDAGSFVLEEVNVLRGICQGLDVINLETGWPSGGNANGDAVPNPSNQVTALKSIQAVTGDVPVNILWAIDGEEEIGAPHGDVFIQKKLDDLMTADALWMGGMHQDASGVMQVYRGYKGTAKVELEIASGEWDGIIVTHSSFERIGMSRDYQEKFLTEQIAEYDKLLLEHAAEKGANRNLIKTIEKQKAARCERLKDLLAEDKKDDGLVFDELGVDHVFIDEAHYFKNLETPTKMERVAGTQKLCRVLPSREMSCIGYSRSTDTSASAAPGRTPAGRSSRSARLTRSIFFSPAGVYQVVCSFAMRSMPPGETSCRFWSSSP